MIDPVDRPLSTLNKLLIKPLKGASSSLKMSGRFCLQNFGQLWIFWWRQNPTFSPITSHWELAQAAEHRGLRLTWATVNGHNVGAPAWNSAMFFTNWCLGHSWMVRYIYIYTHRFRLTAFHWFIDRYVHASPLNFWNIGCCSQLRSFENVCSCCWRSPNSSSSRTTPTKKHPMTF